MDRRFYRGRRFTFILLRLTFIAIKADLPLFLNNEFIAVL